MADLAQLHYDQRSDVLYLSAGEPRAAISREVSDDILLRIDPETGEIVGMTILNLAARFGNLEQPRTLPVHLTLEAT
ncbi:MAG: DUF2283 domain-containing protein [Anaerolineae bacterium]|nr:DUF2283 domain-containing protein [Anaerolineae bacterium]